MYAYLDVPFCLVVFFIFSFLAFFFSFFSNDAEGGLFAADERLSSSSEKKKRIVRYTNINNNRMLIPLPSRFMDFFFLEFLLDSISSSSEKKSLWLAFPSW